MLSYLFMKLLLSKADKVLVYSRLRGFTLIGQVHRTGYNERGIGRDVD